MRQMLDQVKVYKELCHKEERRVGGESQCWVSVAAPGRAGYPPPPAQGILRCHLVGSRGPQPWSLPWFEGVWGSEELSSCGWETELSLQFRGGGSLLFSCGPWASPCAYFSSCGAQAPGPSACSNCGAGSSRTRDQTCVPWTGRRILDHCPTREALEKSFIWVKPRTSPQAHFPDDSEVLLWRSTVSSMALYLDRTKEHQTSQGSISRKKIHLHSKSAWPLTWEGSLILKGGAAWESQEGRRFIFIFNMDALYFWPMNAFLY